jgi:cytochrome c
MARCLTPDRNPLTWYGGTKVNGNQGDFMKSMVLTVGIAGLLLAGFAHAQSGEDLAKAKKCMTCHDQEKKKVGPAYKDIAAKYKGNKDAEAAIVAKLKDAKGHPAKVTATDAEWKSLAQYALTGK